MRPFYPCFALFCLLGCSLSLHAQGWERDYPHLPHPSSTTLSAHGMTELTDGNFLARVGSKLYKISALGDLLAYEDSLLQHYGAYTKIYPLPDGEALVVGSWDGGQYFRVRIDENLQFHWLGTFKAVYGDFRQLPDGGFLTTGIIYGRQLKAIRLGPALDTLWTQTVDFPLDNAFDPKGYPSIHLQSDGSTLIRFARTRYQWPIGTIPHDQGLLHLGPTGNVLWSQTFPPFSDANVLTKLAFDATGHYYRWNSNLLRKYELTGTLLWEKTAAEVMGQPTAQIAVLSFHSDGHLNLCGATSGASSNVLFSKITPNGSLVWARQFGYPDVAEKGVAVLHTQDGGYLVGGSRLNRAYLVRTDSLGQKTPHIAFGKVARDNNQNCLPDPGEPPFSQLVLESATIPPMYRSPDSLGNFSFELPFAQQKLAVKSLNPFWIPCQDTIPIDLADQAVDTIQVAVKQLADCPFLRIGMATWGIRRCFSNAYKIDYCNEGTATASTPQVTLWLNSALQFDSASLIPTATNGNSFLFTLPELAPGDCGSITVWFTAPCTVNLGTELCSTVAIQQDTLCLPTAVFEFGDYSPFQDRDCHPVIGSFDPNDKAAQPLGSGPSHLLARDSTLHYLIRFQNTGTDTAFTVIVRDSLHRWLDPASFRLEVASHPVVASLSGLGILELRFPNIMLPDSFVNEPASHGFAKFSLRIRPQVPALTRIENFAAIYFDFNEPVLTNTVFHTIDRLWFRTPLDTAICQGQVLWGNVIQHDTILMDTLTFPENYLIVTAQVTALSSYESQRDTVVTIGQTVANQLITSAVQLVPEIFATAEGCDSVIIWQVTGLVGTATPGTLRQLWPQPNPAHDWLTLPLTFPAHAVESVQIRMAGGQPLPVSFLPSGEHSLRLNVRSLPPGWYFGQLRQGEQWYVFRFVRN